MRITLLMNFVAPYRLPLLEALRDRAGQLRVLISTPMERERAWTPDWGSLDVVLQRNLVLRRPYRSGMGYTRQLEIHLPYDTIPQLAAYRPDAVISVELGMRTLQAALFRLLRPRTPFLVWAMLSEHSEREWGPVRRLLRRFILRRADGVMVNGESGARYIAGFGVPDALITRVNQPVDVALFAREPRARPDGAATRLLYSGLLVPRKGVVAFAEALEAWARHHASRAIEMWWLGDGEQRAALEARALPPNLSYRFLGHVPYAALPAVYAQADLLAFPSLLDEWGLVVNEAMAAGLPVIGSIYSQAVEELVRDGEHGWVYDPLVPGATLQVITRALDTPPDALTDMRAAVRRRIAGLTPETAADRVAGAVRAAQARLVQREPARQPPALQSTEMEELP